MRSLHGVNEQEPKMAETVSERFDAAVNAAVALFHQTWDLHPHWDLRIEKVDGDHVRVSMYQGDRGEEWQKHDVLAREEELPIAIARCLLMVVDGSNQAMRAA